MFINALKAFMQYNQMHLYLAPDGTLHRPFDRISTHINTYQHISTHINACRNQIDGK